MGLTTTFPRTALTVTQTDTTNTVPYLLTLTQESPRDDYELWGWARLFAGVEVPSTTTASVGSEQVDVQSTGLVKTPQEVLEAYIDALNAPDGENGALFADDPVRQSVAAARATDVAAAGEVSVSASAGTDGFKGLRTTEGGAIVTTTLSYSTVYKKTVAGATFNLGGTVGTLLGSDTEVRGTAPLPTMSSLPSRCPPQTSVGRQWLWEPRWSCPQCPATTPRLPPSIGGLHEHVRCS